jgi:transposase
MSDRSGLSRGDRNRDARLARLRQLLPAENAIVGIDLADDKQAAVVADHDSRVLARRRVSARAWELGGLLDWAVARASAAGIASVTVVCEPTGHRWRVLDQLAAERGLALVCVQPLLACRAREGEDLTRDKSDPKDAVIIARLAAGLHCYEPERADAAASPGSAPRSADHQRDGAGQSDPGSAGVRMAGGAGLAVPAGELARGGSGGAGPVRG